MAFLGIKIEHQVARLISSIKVPGIKVPSDHMHVTVLYLGEEVPIQQVADAIVATYNVTSLRLPFNLKIGKIKCFPMIEGEGYPIIAPIISQELHAFHDDVAKTFDKHKIEYSKKFLDYKPHVTLAYAEEPIKCTPVENGIQWVAHEATLWAGDWGDDRLSASFPFTITPPKTGFYRSLLKTTKK